MRQSKAQEDRAIWIEDGLEALDLSALLFDNTGRLVAFNSRYARTFHQEVALPQPGEDIDTVMASLARAGRAALFAGLDCEALTNKAITAVRGFKRRFDVPMVDGRVLEGSSNPTPRGGCLVTFRDTGRDRLSEWQALELLGEAFGGADVGILSWDASLKVQIANQAWIGLFGPVPDGGSVLEHLPAFMPKSNDGHDPQLSISRLHQGANRHELVLEDGREIQIATFLTPSQNVLATALDVSEIRSAEARARAMLEDAVEALGEGVALYGRDFKLLMSNRAFRQLVFDNQQPSEPGTLLDQEIRQLIAAGRLRVPSEPTTDDLANWLHDCIRQECKGIELCIAERTLELSTFATALGGYLIALRDITERKRAEQATREADELVRTIVEASPTTFLVSRVEDGHIIYAPAASRQRFGDIKTTLSFFLHPSDRQTYLDALLRTGSLQDYPVRFKRGDGSIMNGLTSARLVDFKGEKVIVSSTRDITDQLAMEAELARQREIAHQNEKLSAMGELLAGVAHELNNPLSVVVGYAMMLQDKIADPIYAHRIAEISTAAERCARIVRTFLAMARQRPAEIAAVDINELAEVAVEVAGYGLRAEGATLDFQPGEQLPPIAADADQIVQVFSNLIVNAEHALRELGAAGRLSVRTFLDDAGDQVMAEFTDNGPGIPPHIRARIFEPFFTTKDVGTGTGIGLAFCHRIITAHRGRISVGSEPGRGTRFTIALPRSHADSVAIDPSPRRPDNGHVLVVDDDPTVAGLVAEILRDGGHRVALARRGADALALCRHQPYDAIICDVRMPGMNGLEFHAELQRLAPAAARRVAFLTGDSLSVGIAQGLKQSERPWLEKPAAPNELLDLVQRLMEEAS